MKILLTLINRIRALTKLFSASPDKRNKYVHEMISEKTSEIISTVLKTQKITSDLLMVLSLFALLLVSSLGYATVPASINSQGMTFPDNTLQNPVAILPLCNAGEVYVKIAGSMVCGKIVPIPNEILTCNENGQCIVACGDGIIGKGEACDDGNTSNGDGCSATCQIEPGFFCNGSPSACNTLCGDDMVAGTEQCDDGNTTAGDGCSPVCTIEAGYTCSGTPSVCNPK